MKITLSEFLATNNRAIYPEGCEFQQLFPPSADLLTEIKDQIISEFYMRQVSTSPPQAWLRRWHALINRKAETWKRLLLSEVALRADDAIYNYDMVEESTSTGNTTASASTSGTSTSTASGQGYESDTPDGSLNDIENYMSSGSKSSSTTSGQGSDSSSSEGTSTSSHTLTRKGNIGVMTSAQIIGGYREATDYSAYWVIFRDCEPFFIGVWSEDEEMGWIY